MTTHSEDGATAGAGATTEGSTGGRLGGLLRGWLGGALIGLAAGLYFFPGQAGTLDDGTRAHMLVPVLVVAARNGLVALLWWLAALGLGFGILRLVRRARGEPAESAVSRDAVALALAAGAAALLFIDAVLGSCGLLSAPSAIAGWAPIAAGGFIAVRTFRDRPLVRDASEPRTPSYAATGIGFMVALMATAAASSPGWLWSSEFGGYDALSYHLELPKHWLLHGAAAGPVEGNVYSALPSFVECAFLHLMSMRGSPIDGAFACQWWAVFATLATAFVVARLGRATGLAMDGAGAAIAFLAIPWAIVVGTLAYNDIAPLLFLAGGWLALASLRTRGEQIRPADAALLALLAAAAVGAKPTAIVFVALPMLALTIHLHGWSTLRLAPLVLATAVAILSPWLVRNGLSYGNPFFPFLAGVFGDGPWSPEQHQIFHAAHGPVGGFLDRLATLWREWITHGLGAPPAPNEPWYPQWGIAPAAGALGLAIAARRSRHAVSALVVVAVMVAGWMLFTHLKSRFLLPTAVPLVLGVCVMLGLVARVVGRSVTTAIAVALFALPITGYLREPVKRDVVRQPAAAVDQMAIMTGVALREQVAAATPDKQRELLALASTPFVINHLLPKDSRVLSIGFATPFYLLNDIDSTTVWDRGPFDRTVAAAPNDPSSWANALRLLGYTHVLLDPKMLSRWKASGWLNPAISDERWVEPFLRTTRPVGATVEGTLILELSAP